MYVNKNTDAIVSVLEQARPSSGRRASNPTEAISGLQSRVEALDKLTDNLRIRGGVSGPLKGIVFDETPWKADDAAWFKSHPDRSHRMRMMHPDELTNMPSQFRDMTPPEDHRWEILVRQIEEGQRVRTPFCRNTLIDIPDEEEVIHAIFDTVASPRHKGVITVEEVKALADRYSTPSSRSH